ncbi:MAG: MBL fold metallo-hydrolase [Gemmatimonadaceae bacterium]
MNVRTFVTGAFQENCYLLSDAATGQAVIVDPGADGETLVDRIQKARVQLTAIWVTHSHVDHIGGIAPIVRAFHVPIYAHPAGQVMYERGAEIAAMYGIPFESPPPADHDLAEGDVLAVGGLQFSVMETPGHAPGHVTIHGHGIAFVGDCLFAGSIGRTDLPLSNGQQLEQSLARIAALPESTVVYSGHGPATTVGEELRTNPFLTGMARPIKR